MPASDFVSEGQGPAPRGSRFSACGAQRVRVLICRRKIFGMAFDGGRLGGVCIGDGSVSAFFNGALVGFL